MISAPQHSPFLLAPPAAPSSLESSGTNPAEKRGDDELRRKFQDFTAGTIFKQMLKALRKTHDKAAYLHGGQAEETFRKLLDERVAEQLATEHGAAFSDPLFDSFARRIPVKAVSAEPSNTSAPNETAPPARP